MTVLFGGRRRRHHDLPARLDVVLGFALAWLAFMGAVVGVYLGLTKAWP